MTQDPFSMWDDPPATAGELLGELAPSVGVDVGFSLDPEPEEVEVLDADGRVIGVIDLS